MTKSLNHSINNISQEDSGNYTYTCLVKNQSGENGSKTIELDVKGINIFNELKFQSITLNLVAKQKRTSKNKVGFEEM